MKAVDTAQLPMPGAGHGTFVTAYASAQTLSSSRPYRKTDAVTLGML